MPNIQIRSLTKSYGTHAGLEELDLDIPDGDRLAILGPSGSGKSTLLRLLAGLEQPDRGEIRIQGRNIQSQLPHERGIVFVPQRAVLYPHLNVRENLEVAGRHRFSKLGDSREKIIEILRISHLLDRAAPELSGGERQRVVLARAAMMGAPIWLLDEPFAPLDPVLHSEIRLDLHLLLDRSAATILLVTHDPIDAMALGRRVGVLGKSRLQQIGTPDLLRLDPANQFVAFALGQLSFLKGSWITKCLGGGDLSDSVFVSEDGTVEVSIPRSLRSRLRAAPSRNLTLGIRPEDVSIRLPGIPSGSDTRIELTGWQIVFAEPVGSGSLLTIAREQSRLRVGWVASSPPPVGAITNWCIPRDHCLWFDPEGTRLF